MIHFNSFAFFYPLSFLSFFLKAQKVGTCTLNSPFLFYLTPFLESFQLLYGTFYAYPKDQRLGLVMDKFQVQNATQSVLKP